MARFLYPKFQMHLRKSGHLILAFCFSLGFILGMFLQRYAGSSIVSLMCRAVSSRVSIVGLMIPFLLPFLFSAMAVYWGIPCVIPLIAFLKAALFSFTGCSVIAAFGSAGWVIRMLFLFSDSLFIVLLYLYWSRHITFEKRFRAQEAVLFLLGALIISGMDFLYISPFLRSII